MVRFWYVELNAACADMRQHTDADGVHPLPEGCSTNTRAAELVLLWIVHTARFARGELRGALHLRHWLAHGRYWKAQLGRKEYDAQAIFNIVSEVFQRLPDVEGWPGGTAPTSS